MSGASIGIAMFRHDYQDVESIMQDADLAMYQAKSLGRGQFVVFEPSMRANITSDDILHSSARVYRTKMMALCNRACSISVFSNQVELSVCTGLFHSLLACQSLMPEKCQSQIEQSGLRLQLRLSSH